MGETEEFNTLAFEKRLMQLKDTQESIQSLSSWCLKQKTHHKKIVASWLNVLKRVKVEQRLVLFYLANDVIQYSKRKNYEFVDSWGLYLQKATPLVRDEKVRTKILRIFKIWEQRSVYDEEFLSDLTGLLSAGALKKTDDEVIDFQPQQLVNKIKQCSVLEADTDQRLKSIHDSHLNIADTDVLCANLKDKFIHSTDKRSKDDIEKDLNEGIHCVEKYTQALQREIVAREALLALLSSANQYYSTQRGEVKVVAYAYKNFGARVRTLKRKLDDLIPTLPEVVPSPPQRDEDVPSPGPDEDIDLPPTTDNDDVTYNIDKTFNSSIGADGSLYNLGLSSFLTSDNPMALFNESNNSDNSTSKIEVINTRPNENQDFNINDFLKTLSNDTTKSTSNLVSSTTKADTLPGLDLLTPDSTGNPPPSSFYGASVEPAHEEPEPYTPEPYTPEPYIPRNPEPTSHWTNSSWMPLTSLPPPPPVPPPTLLRDTPESPPPPPVPPLSVPPPILPTTPYTNTSLPPPSDVDHRGMIPPPPPPPMLPPLLSSIEDVDHRLLPTLPPPPVPPPLRHQSQDVDHRNLISLTHQPPAHEPAGDTNSVDQDYRVPPSVPPTDIVESVDMDLSEDEEAQAMYPSNQSQPESRRNSYNNNKVLVGGDPNMNDAKRNLPRSNSAPEDFHIPPAPPLMSISFEDLQDDANEDPNAEGDYKYEENYPEYQKEEYNNDFQKDDDYQEGNEEPFEDDIRSRSLDTIDELDSEWRNRPRPVMNNRFPRNWTPRTNRPFAPQNQFWPRNGPRTPNRWMGPRPPRFW